MSADTRTSSTVPAAQQRSSRYLIGAGIVVALLGLLAILAPFVTGIGLSITLGVLLVVGALAHVAHAFSARGWTGSLWQIVLGVVYAVAGVSLLVNPVLGLTTLTLLLIGYLAASGIVELVIGVKMRPDSQWGLFVASGAVSLVLAGLLWAGFPGNVVWAVGLLVGIHLLTTGATLAAVGYFGGEASTPSGEETPEGSPRGG
jgi:uncharacterized membrane protein HdeD (DUF308 family)